MHICTTIYHPAAYAFVFIVYAFCASDIKRISIWMFAAANHRLCVALLSSWDGLRCGISLNNKINESGIMKKVKWFCSSSIVVNGTVQNNGSDYFCRTKYSIDLLHCDSENKVCAIDDKKKVGIKRWRNVPIISSTNYSTYISTIKCPEYDIKLAIVQRQTLP